MAPLPATVIVGGGRLGRGLGGLLVERGVRVRYAVRRGGAALPAPAGSFDDPASYRGARWILIATPDDAIRDVADRLGGLGVVRPGMVVLHLSGARDRGVLKPLRLTGAALGAFHPLQTIAVPMTAAERLAGAYAGLDGDPAAIRAGRRLARSLGMIPVVIPEGAKAAYHAAATLVSSYVVVLYDAAIRIATEAGIAARDARTMFLPLLEGTVANLRLLPPGPAITGAVRRGDVATVEAHLRSLSRGDRDLYRVLGRRALPLVRRVGLDPARLAALERLFGAAGER